MPVFCAGWNWVYGPVQPPDPRVRRGAVGEDHRRVPGPVPVVRGRQTTAVPTVDQTRWPGTTAGTDLQVVPGYGVVSSLWRIVY